MPDERDLPGVDKEVTHYNPRARVSIPEDGRRNGLLSPTGFTGNNTKYSISKAFNISGSPAGNNPESIRLLNKGDHYILVLWDQQPSTERPPHDSLKLLGTAILVIAVMLGIFVLLDHYGIDWNSGPKTYTSMPLWIQRLIIPLMAGVYVYYVILPWILKKPPVGIGQLALRLFRAGLRAGPKGKTER